MKVPFERVKELVAELGALDSVRRAARLDEECGQDPELRAEVESLLAFRDKPDSFLDRPLQLGRQSVSSTWLTTVCDHESSLPRMPEQIGEYRILGRIATGGMGAVYRAEQANPARVVALKTIRPEFISEALILRFRRESELLGRLQHRGIAQIFGAGVFDQGAGPEPFFALEFIEGLPLLDYATKHRLQTAQRVALVIEICEAVEHAHQKGVVHRDLKPDNILVDGWGQPKILDFGIARSIDAEVRRATLHTDPGQLVGTVAYMSPEQVAGDPSRIDGRSDVYTLGVLLFELLAECLPLSVHGQPLHEAARVIREDSPTRLGSLHTRLRGDLEVVVDKALEKDPARRYASALALADDLRRYLAHTPITARPPSAFYRLQKFTGRHKALVLGASSTVLVSVAGAVVAGWFAVRSARDEAKAIHALALAKITIADSALEMAPRTARQALDEVPRQTRGWEWRHLDACLQPLAQYRLPPAPGAPTQRGSVAIAADGTPSYVHVEGRRVSVRHLASGVATATFTAPIDLQRVRLAAGGGQLVGVSVDATRLLVFAARDGETLLDSPGHEGLGNPAISADGSRVAVEVAGGKVQVFDVATGGLVVTLGATWGNGKLRTPVLSANGDRVALHGWFDKGGSLLYVYDCASGKLAQPQMTVGYLASAFAPRGDRLVVSTGGQSLTLVETGSGAETSNWVCTERMFALAFDDDASLLATASHREVRVWDVARQRSVAAFSTGAHELALSADGSMLAAATDAGGWLWRLGENRCTTLTGTGVRVVAVAFHPDGSLVASLTEDGQARIWDATSGALIASASVESTGPDCPSGGLHFSADGGQLVVSRRRHRVWDLVVGDGFGPPIDHALVGSEVVEYWRHCGPRDCRVGAVSNSGVVFEPGPEGIAMFDARTDDALTSPIRFPGGPLASAVAVSPDGQLVATGHLGGRIRIWDRNSGIELRSVSAHDDYVYGLDFSPDGSRLVSGGLDFSVRVWDVATLDQVIELRGHRNSMRAVAFSADGSQIASCSSDGTVRLWDSVPAHERTTHAARAAERREVMRSRVTGLVAERGRAAALAWVRAQANLDEADRRAAQRVLLELGQTAAEPVQASGR